MPTDRFHMMLVGDVKSGRSDLNKFERYYGPGRECAQQL